MVLLGLFLVVAVIACAGYFASRPKETNSAPPPVVTVTVEPAGVRPLTKEVTVTGTVSPFDPITIGSEISGLKIVSVRAEEGDLVKKGQILATLNSSVLQAELAQAKAKLAASVADLKKAIQPNRREDIFAYQAAYEQAKAAIAEEEAGLAQAKANLTDAEDNVLRYRELVADGAVSKQDAETRETTAKTAKAMVGNAEQKISAARFSAEQARQKMSMAQVGGRKEDITVAQANLAEIKANVAQLQAQVEQTNIVAPDDGLISKRDCHIGDIANVGQSLFSEVRANRLELRAQVSDIDLAKFHPGQKVQIQAAGKDNAATGSVRIVSPLVDTTTRLGTVRIDLPSDAGLKSGMFVRGTVALGQMPALCVPAKSVISRDSNAFVFVLNGIRASMQAVVTGYRGDDFVEVLSGVKSGDKIIVKGAGFLKDGDVVQVGE